MAFNSRKYYLDNQKNISEYQRQYRLKHKATRTQEKIDKTRKYKIKYYQEHKDQYRKDYQLYIKKYPRIYNKQKQKTRNQLNYKIYSGKIKRGLFCELCNGTEIIDAHHYSYSSPYHFVWLCRSCHKTIHYKLINNKLND